MTDAKTDQEPTMEEILASIRRIISEDDPEEAAAPAETPSEDPVDDVLELTEVADEPEPEPESEFEPEPEPEAEAETDIEFGEDEFEPEAEPEPEPEAEPEPAVAAVATEEEVIAMDDESLVSQAAGNAVSSAFAGLSAALGNTRIEGRTMEDIVKELMRPMLKEWLDANLPSLVEQIVREEVERLSKRR